MRSGSRCPAFYGEIPPMRWGILNDDGGYFYCITYTLFHESFELILANFADHFVVEVLYKMEVVEDRPDVWAFFKESLFKIRVHVQRDGINMAHPIHTDMLDEVVNDLLLFPLCNPENMSGCHIYDMGRILMSVMQLELIYPKEAGVMLWLHELSVFDVEGFQPAFVDCLYCMLVQTTKLGHLLVGICAEGKQVTDVSLQLFRDAVMI